MEEAQRISLASLADGLDEIALTELETAVVNCAAVGNIGWRAELAIMRMGQFVHREPGWEVPPFLWRSLPRLRLQGAGTPTLRLQAKEGLLAIRCVNAVDVQIDALKGLLWQPGGLTIEAENLSALVCEASHCGLLRVGAAMMTGSEEEEQSATSIYKSARRVAQSRVENWFRSVRCPAFEGKEPPVWRSCWLEAKAHFAPDNVVRQVLQDARKAAAPIHWQLTGQSRSNRK